MKNGREFEERVANLFIDNGFIVNTNLLIERNGVKAEIDILVREGNDELFIECKSYSSRIKLRDVAKYVSVLELMNIPFENAIMVAEPGYTKRAKHFANSKGLLLYTYKELWRWLNVKYR